MITFRRSLVAALFLLSCILLLHSSHSAKPLKPSHTSSKPIPNRKQNQQEKSPSSAELNQPPKSLPHSPDLARKTLRDRLRYQFPYDLPSKFPAYIWQTWKNTPASPDFYEHFRTNEASWTIAHPTFIHQVITDDDMDPLLRYLYAPFPEIIETYRSLPLPVLKADFFRYLILLARGGIYSDIDTYVLKPADEWLPRHINRSTVGLVVGIEADTDREDWAQWFSRRLQFCQWTIQAKPGHPVLRDVVATITEDALRMKEAGILIRGMMDKSVMEFTGPAVWTDAIFRYFNNPLYFETAQPPNGRNLTAHDFSGVKEHRQLGDVVVLPITSFSPGVGHMGAGGADDPMAFVKHHFSGSWKSEEAGRPAPVVLEE
ncbi:initiation-specific alpha-1,6-mannosyltransferase [Paracoccidioides lutzii Pb01]|uniref:Initiation-specific alpha-1,6-mannosyltransferase n=1 Tax=Paracoccidioides lutzii (strain ATCC MYA-826 / Pb01) TaxID=502779 RepID=C1GZV7_PARBA|nr:initiation-specific alpha-1,6-mannosyltransferase [Paracoccidioides lutzii Pb01]EEH32998.1 initiation-specific alpha-1,6-mannosyltransferase [Paracoccidioides lutzii Pb01]